MEQQDLWAAFKAGFMSSCEGWNGEFRLDTDDAELRDRYKEWIQSLKPPAQPADPPAAPAGSTQSPPR